MLRTLSLALSALALPASVITATATHPESGQPPPPHRPGYMAEYRSLVASERADRMRPAPPASPPSVQDLIRNAFQPLGPQAVSWAEQIAWCESKYDPHAVNPYSDAEGLFQFLPSTWAGTPFASASPFDPAVNARAAAWLLQTYGPTQWECQA